MLLTVTQSDTPMITNTAGQFAQTLNNETCYGHKQWKRDPQQQNNNEREYLNIDHYM